MRVAIPKEPPRKAYALELTLATLGFFVDPSSGKGIVAHLQTSLLAC
jgi:hypothetical protein